jgi:hypothetical protein
MLEVITVPQMVGLPLQLRVFMFLFCNVSIGEALQQGDIKTSQLTAGQ